MPSRRGEDFETHFKDFLSAELDSSGFFWHTEEDIQHQYDLALKGIMDEQDFFDAVGVDGAIALDGLTDTRADECNGWTYGIPDMAKYNVQDIAYLSDDQYPDPDALQKYGICLI